jgi:hypothetical protein
VHRLVLWQLSSLAAAAAAAVIATLLAEQLQQVQAPIASPP